MIAIITILLIILIPLALAWTTLFFYLIYWIAQFFKQKAITEQQKNKNECYKK